MEEFVALLIPGLLAILLVRLLLMPIRFAVKAALYSGCGFACLWLLNTVSGLTGIFFPINAVTVFTAGFLGLPGIALMALLAIL